jgi:Lipocalin-like domain
MRVTCSAKALGMLIALMSALGCAPPLQAADAGPIRADGGPIKKEQLVGAWRLVSMDYRGPDDASVDPFYQPDSTGLIIYDASGWMSVHIAGPHRQAWKVPASRLPTTGSPQDSALKAAAFDGYYAYFGTWDLDEAQSVVTHHVVTALLPAEEGQSYAQQVALENGRLIFTNRSGPQGRQTVRHKIWERVTR